MILSGHEIQMQILKGKIAIEDFDEARLGPNSYNLRLGRKLLTYEEGFLNPKKPNKCVEHWIDEDGAMLMPGVLYLAETMEYPKTEGFVPMVEGRSSVGRLGININATAGFGDVGFKVRWTLELSCIQPVMV